MNGKILMGAGVLLFAWCVAAAIYHQFPLAAVLAAFGGAAVVWGAKTLKGPQ